MTHPGRLSSSTTVRRRTVTGTAPWLMDTMFRQPANDRWVLFDEPCAGSLVLLVPSGRMAGTAA